MQYPIQIFKSPAFVLLTVQVCSMFGLFLAGFFAAGAGTEASPEWLIISTSLVLLATAPDLHSFNLLISRRYADTELVILSQAFLVNSLIQAILTIALLAFFLWDGLVPASLLATPMLLTIALMQISMSLNPALIKRHSIHLVLLDGLVNFTLPLACQGDLINYFFIFLLFIVLLKLPVALKPSTGIPAPVLWGNFREILSLKFTAVIRSTFLLSVISVWQHSNIIDNRFLFIIPLMLRILSALSGLLNNIAGIKRLISTHTQEFSSADEIVLTLILLTCLALSGLSMPLTLLFSVALIEIRSIFYAQHYVNFYFNNAWHVNMVIGVSWYFGLVTESTYLTSILLTIDILVILISVRLSRQ